MFVLFDENKSYVLWRFKLFQTYLDFTDLINKLDREIVIHDWFFWHDFYTDKKNILLLYWEGISVIVILPFLSLFITSIASPTGE